MELARKSGANVDVAPTRDRARMQPTPLARSDIDEPVADRGISRTFAGIGHDFGTIAVHSASSLRLQPKLTVNQPGDIYEQQADRVADQIMRMPDPAQTNRRSLSGISSGLSVQKKCPCGGSAGPTGECDECCKKRLQRKIRNSEPGTQNEPSVPPIVHEVLRSPGRPLDPATRAFMQPLFGHGFSQVRVHDNSQAADLARSVKALAFTVGPNIVFNAGQYRPASGEGRRLLAHELSHVIQQGSGPVGQQPKLALAQVDSAAGREPEESARQATDSYGKLPSPTINARRALQRAPDGPSPTALETLNVTAGKALGSRPQSASLWQAYARINYDVIQGEEKVHEVWKFIGGNVGRDFDGQNTCATRVSYALNYGGFPIAHYDGRTSFRNDPSTKFEGKAGDGKNYIVGAPAMSAYFAGLFGVPDAQLATRPDAVAFQASLMANQCAVFAGVHHSGMIKHEGYADPYLIGNGTGTGDPGGVLPVNVWKLT